MATTTAGTTTTTTTTTAAGTTTTTTTTAVLLLLPYCTYIYGTYLYGCILPEKMDVQLPVSEYSRFDCHFIGRPESRAPVQLQDPSVPYL